MTTKIEWTDETWNPVTGCTKVSQGCHFCYAERLWPKVDGARVKREGGAPRAFTDVRCHPERLDAPLHWRTPRRIFVNSMSDLFHEEVPSAFIGKVFGVMAVARQHVFQVLTKRPQRMLDLLADGVVGPLKGEADQTAFEIRRERSTTAEEASRWPGLKWPLPNVWLGVSVEDQATADERVPLLLRIPAAIRFVSYEPALGPINLGWYLLRFDPMQGDKTPNLRWLIAGGESGPNARPPHPDWFRSVRDQCAEAGLAFFFKQWGEWAPDCRCGRDYPCKTIDRPPPGKGVMFRCGKRRAGRLLDDREHNEYPA
jgi:protein gp37